MGKRPQKRQNNRKGKTQLIDRYGLFSADLLKIAALVTMFLDHIGAGILENWILYHYNGDAAVYQKVLAADTVLRCVGRVSFLLYCWLLVQGFLHTGNRIRYAARLLLFAVISELPFDYLFFNGFTWEHQNVFWTLLIALITLILIEYLEHLEDFLIPEKKTDQLRYHPLFSVFLKAFTVTAVIATGMLVAHFLRTDYSWKGVMLVSALYLTRQDRKIQSVLPSTLFLAAYFLEYILLGWEPLAALSDIFNSKWTVYLASLLIWRCNGKKTMKSGKYFFYFFYPAHILLLLFVRFLLF